jgi:hypothetical protein
MFEQIEPDLFAAAVMVALSLLGASVATALAFVSLDSWLRRRRSRRVKLGLQEIHTGAILLAGELAGKAVKVTKIRTGRTKKAKAIKSASEILKAVDSE